MRVLLISANTERMNMTTMPLGLALVAAATRRAGHEVTVLDLLTAGDPGAAVRAAVAAARPEAIGISVRNIDDQDRQEPRFLAAQARDVVARCRAASPAPVVLGGAGYSICPHGLLDFLGADFGIRGDGEAAFPELLDRLARGRDPHGLPGLHVRGEETDSGLALAADLDALPLWDPCLASFAGEAAGLWVPVQSRRGCPHRCSYCSTAAIQGCRYRPRSPRLVADALAAQAGAGFRRFYFVDNSFNLPGDYALELCREIRSRRLDIEWNCILYPNFVSEELVSDMAAAGCTAVSLGFESASPAVLAAMNKQFRAEDVRRVSDRLAARGIRRMGFLMFGGPGETRATVEESLAFTDSLGLEELVVTVGIRLYPGTPLARRAVAEGVVAPGQDLLHPSFYLAPGLEPWIYEHLAARGLSLKDINHRDTKTH